MIWVKGEFPITTLRPIPIKKCYSRNFWIYQDQTNDLSVLNDKYNVKYWKWVEVDGTGTIGERYGAVVKKHDIIRKILKQLEANPWNRRNVISLWDYEAFEIQMVFCHVLSKPCMMCVVLMAIFILMPLWLNVQMTCWSYTISMLCSMLLSKWWLQNTSAGKVGKFFYFVNNLHIYDNQFEQAKELLAEPTDCKPRLVLNARWNRFLW